MPDFWAISGGAGLGDQGIRSIIDAQGMKIVDRFGQSYVSVGGSVGVGIEWAYHKGYMGVPEQVNTKHSFRTIRTPDEMVRRLEGWNNCFTAQGSLGYGVSISLCMDKTFILTYSFGLQAGIGGSIPFVVPGITSPSGTRNPMNGWQWAIDERLNGIMRVDVQNFEAVYYDGCSRHIPLNVR